MLGHLNMAVVFLLNISFVKEILPLWKTPIKYIENEKLAETDSKPVESL